MVLLLTFAGAEERTARLFEIGQTSGSPLYVQKIKIKNEDGKRVQTSTIEDVNGKIQMTETAVLVDGQIVSQNIDHLQINESYELEVRGNEAVFRTFKMTDGKRGKLTEEEVRKLPKNYVTGPATEPFLKKYSAALTTDQTLESEFGVFEMGRFIGMQFKKKKGAGLSVEMRPSNFFVDLLFAPIQLELDPETFQLRRYIGRTPLRKEVNGKLKPWDAEIIYSN